MRTITEVISPSVCFGMIRKECRRVAVDLATGEVKLGVSRLLQLVLLQWMPPSFDRKLT